MLRRTTRRTGFSLTEVIVALFVMAVGIISLLALFPVGAVQMGYALRDDRSQSTALQADAEVRRWWRQEVVERVATTEDAPFYVMDDPNDPWNPAAVPAHPVVANPAAPNYIFAVRPTGNNVPPARAFPLAIPAVGLNSDKPSYPVLLDPIGLHSYNADARFWVANASAPPAQFAIPRRTFRTAGVNLTQAIRTCSLFDDIEFSKTLTPGHPASVAETGAGAPIVRQGRYNWAAVIQRQNNSIRNVADLKILVYDRRAPGIAPTDAELMYSVPNLTVGTTQIVLPATLDVLKLRTNGWIMDGTIDPVNGIRNINFYRIQTLTEVGAATIVELQTPIKPSTGAPGLATYNAQIYVLSNLIDVYERPQLLPSNYLQQVP
jgi:hypothetical protein